MSSNIKAELEKKKARLAALQRDRDDRRRRKQEQETARAAEAGVPPAGSQRPGEMDINKLIQDVGLPPIPSTGDGDSVTSISTSSDRSASNTPDTSLTTSATSLPSHPPIRKVELKIVQVNETHIPPEEHVSYDKETQTTSTGDSHERRGVDYYVLTYDDLGDGEEDSLPHIHSAPVFQSKLPPGVLHPGMPQVQAVLPPSVEAEDTSKNQEAKPQRQELSEEEKQTLMMTEEFLGFFDRATRRIERALNEDSDILVDYSADLDADANGEEKSGQRLVLNRWFEDERWSRNRVVTSVDWCPQYPELLVASYNNNVASPHDPDGVALVWNTRFKKHTPEYIFHCQSPVMTVSFAKFHPNLILGGTYSGQLVLWDNRVHKRTPVQRSPLSAGAHTASVSFLHPEDSQGTGSLMILSFLQHPVYSLTVVGTAHAHAVVSASNAGRLCAWSLDMLAAPQESLDLVYKQRPVPATCLSFLPNDSNNFVLGSEDACVYYACRHGNKAGVLEAFEGHRGPVTGIDTHRAYGPIEFSHLFLSSSFDWTVKLWSAKERKPLHSFEDNGDYIYDVAWSPIHPSVFAAVDGNGRLDIWNLNVDIEVPTASVVVEEGVALNRVSWTQSGQHICVGDENGRIWVYDLSEVLAVPKADDWSNMMHTLHEMKTNQLEDVEISPPPTSLPMSSPMSSLKL
ncbi:unnamed protein product [Darwinula stevensoni]|uniref:Uncharacterized protein n=1 Tax=Darwinula stevensoni TaxID=69355 RepID=A0A7R9FQ14_9CRUS|nr:unnamed protein product [Darwinula stevensoni]CAG0898624.1 unnamed protein product [Darwinula stevensoni]